MEFKKSIRDLRVDITDKECELLFRVFDRDCNNVIDYDEFTFFLMVNFFK